MRINWIGPRGRRIIALTLSANKPLARTHKLGSKLINPKLVSASGANTFITC
jgi:hypothetical protein